MDKEALITMYTEQLNRAAEQRKLADHTLDFARESLEMLLTQHGKGPYNINGKEVVVLKRKGTLCTMPTKRTRKVSV